MLTDSIYKKDRKCLSPGLNPSVIAIISGYESDQLKELYESYNIKYLMKEIYAWQKLGKYKVAEAIKHIIEERKETSRLIKVSRLKSNVMDKGS